MEGLPSAARQQCQWENLEMKNVELVRIEDTH
jgi:hypothetical protein